MAGYCCSIAVLPKWKTKMMYGWGSFPCRKLPSDLLRVRWQPHALEVENVLQSYLRTGHSRLQTPKGKAGAWQELKEP